MRKCLLCNSTRKSLVRSHIFPKGFFNQLPDRRRVDTLSINGEPGRRLQNALYDSETVCDECEHTILEPLDDYAIKILRDKESATRISVPNASKCLWVFEHIDKRRLRAFIASVLWRASVSRQLEVRSFSIGASREKMIQSALLGNGELSRVDCFLRFLTDPLHGGFFVPYKKQLKGFDLSRDPKLVHGWELQFPNISITVTLDKPRHPLRRQFTVMPDLTGRKKPILISSSLHPCEKKYRFFGIQMVRSEEILNDFFTAIKKTPRRIALHRNR